MDPDHIADLFRELGPVRIRRMFGGSGIYSDELMFALEAGGELYLKADAETIPAFEQEGCGPFTYRTSDGRRSVLSYWRIPDRLVDDPERLAEWARIAIAAAHRSGTKKKSDRRRRSPVKGAPYSAG